MSTFADPNREAVGLEPIWTGAGETPEPKQQAQSQPAEPDEASPQAQQPKGKSKS